LADWGYGRLLIRTLAIWITFLSGSSWLLAAPLLPCSSIPEYRSLLTHVSEAASSPSADFDEIIAEVPIECELESDGKRFSFHTIQIHSALFAIKQADKDKRPAKINELQHMLSLRKRSLDGYMAAVDPTLGPKLKEIFTHPEFSQVGAQDAKALLYEQIMRLLVKLFSLVVKNPEEAAFFAKLFAYCVIGILVLLILWWLYRWIQRKQPEEYVAREIMPFAPSAKSWQEWMKEARAHLELGEFRQAVHSSYWAAISHLESSGAWVPDKARTPREYLRLIPTSNPARPLLAEISRIFEVVWYGERVPGQPECEAFLARVEKIAWR
jgi:hypothetical protein